MRLSRNAVEDFKRIHQEEFGEPISDAEAVEMGLRLLGLFQILSQPPSIEMPKPVSNEQNEQPSR